MGKLFRFVIFHTTYQCLIWPIPITFSPEEVHVETLPRLGKLNNQRVSYRESNAWGRCINHGSYSHTIIQVSRWIITTCNNRKFKASSMLTGIEGFANKLLRKGVIPNTALDTEHRCWTQNICTADYLRTHRCPCPCWLQQAASSNL